MSFKNIIRVFTGTSLSHVKLPLGRWKLHNDKQTILKIKYATEDNCGFSYYNCKNTIYPQDNNELANNELDNNELDNNEYVYMMGYESVHSESTHKHI